MATRCPRCGSADTYPCRKGFDCRGCKRFFRATDDFSKRCALCENTTFITDRGGHRACSECGHRVPEPVTTG